MEVVKRPYTVREEIWSSLIHGIGIALSLAGLIVLVTLAAQNGNVWLSYIRHRRFTMLSLTPRLNLSLKSLTIFQFIILLPALIRRLCW